MAERAIEFVENWVSQNIKAEDYQPDENNPRAKAYALQCIQAAAMEGIPQSEIAESFDDLTAFMAGEIEEANNREVAHRTPDDD